MSGHPNTASGRKQSPEIVMTFDFHPKNCAYFKTGNNMKEILQEILEAEKRAEGTVREAREEALKIKREADEKAEKILQEAREEAQKITKEELSKAETFAEEEFNRELQKVTQAKYQSEIQNTKAFKTLVEQITHMVLHPGDSVS